MTYVNKEDGLTYTEQEARKLIVDEYLCPEDLLDSLDYLFCRDEIWEVLPEEMKAKVYEWTIQDYLKGAFDPSIEN